MKVITRCPACIAYQTDNISSFYQHAVFYYNSREGAIARYIPIMVINIYKPAIISTLAHKHHDISCGGAHIFSTSRCDIHAGMQAHVRLR